MSDTSIDNAFAAVAERGRPTALLTSNADLETLWRFASDRGGNWRQSR
jgi:hypothetical protein